MPSSAIHLLIPDAALRAAVLEQLAQSGFRVTGDAASLGTPPEDSAAVILDETARQAKELKNWQGLRLLLGEAQDATVDESLPKPLRLGHLLARLRYHLDAGPAARGTHYSFGPYSFDPQTRQLTVTDSGEIVRLTEKETALLRHIAASAAPVSRDDLLAAVWGYAAGIDTHTLETHIYQLRRKLDADPRGAGLLLNEQGAYRLGSRNT